MAHFYFNMKKIGIISDTHSWWDDRYVKYFTGCDEIWHAGDIGSQEVVDRLKAIAPLKAVVGNIDSALLRRQFKETEIFYLDGLKVLLTHIGGYPGRYAPGIKTLLLEENPDIFVAGHSHILKVINDTMYKTLYVNPGAAGRQGWQVVSTLVILYIDNGKPVNCEVIELPKPKISV